MQFDKKRTSLMPKGDEFDRKSELSDKEKSPRV